MHIPRTPQEVAKSLLQRKSKDKAIEYTQIAIGNSISRRQLKYWHSVQKEIEKQTE